MPLATMASAWARTVASSILASKWFQLFQPIGGVAAAPGETAWAVTLMAAASAVAASIARPFRNRFICVAPPPFSRRIAGFRCDTQPLPR